MITNAISAYRVGQSPSNKPQNQNFKGAQEVRQAKQVVNHILIRTGKNAPPAKVLERLAKAVERVYAESGYMKMKMKRKIDPQATRIMRINSSPSSAPETIIRRKDTGFSLIDPDSNDILIVNRDPGKSKFQIFKHSRELKL